MLRLLRVSLFLFLFLFAASISAKQPLILATPIFTTPTAAQGVTMTAVPGTATSAVVLVYGSASVAITVTASSMPAWLTAASAPATDNGSPIVLSANAAGLQAGEVYTGQVVISAPSLDASYTLPVSLSVLPPGSCLFTLTSASANLPSTGTASPGGFEPETPIFLGIQPAAGSICSGSYTVASSAPWLSAVAGTSGFTYTALSNPQSVPRGATITIASNGGGSQTLMLTEAGDTVEPLLDRQVRALYQTVLGRDPDSAGFAFWTGSGAAGLTQMADSFLTSPEAFNTNFAVIATYQAATGAPPTYAQFTAAVAPLRAGTQTAGSLFSALIAGNSSFSAATLYQNLLDRAPAPSEVSDFQAGPVSWFQTLIGFPATSTPAAAVNNEFQSTGTFADHASAAGDHTNSLYITMLYFVILSRDPDVGGLAFWIGVAGTGGAGLLFQGPAGLPTRFQILGAGLPLQGFLGSVEFEGLYQ